MKLSRLIILLSFILTLSATGQSRIDAETNWHAWRGPLATGVAPKSNPPVSWSENQNVKWRTAIPGKGFSTPVVWDNLLFVTTAIPKEGAPDSTIMPYIFKVLAVDRSNGNIIWERTVAEEEVKNRIHPTSSHVSNSSVTDGKYLYAYFGSRGLFCLDFKGNMIWKRDFGQMEKKNNFGEGASPALYGNSIVVQWDHEGESAIFCLDKRNGNDIWKRDRDELTTWSTPLILEYGGVVQVIASGSTKVRSYNLENGDLIWECGGLTSNVTPNPVYHNNLLYVMSGYRGNALMAINMAVAKGDITDSEAIVWSTKSNTSYVPSPLLINGRLYFHRSNGGDFSCLDAATGNVLYGGQELADLGIVYNSPVAAGGNIYILGGSGLAYTLKEGPAFEIIATNKLDDSFFSSIAIAGDELFIRGLKYLYCIAKD